MKLQFTKRDHQTSVFKCVRPDGTETWMKITQPFMLEHDLVHYAVEIVLGFRNAFYGLLLQGYNITDFEAPQQQRLIDLLPINLPLEAKQAEILVGLFQTERHDGDEIEDFINIAQFTFQAQETDFPEIHEEEVMQIRTQIQSLLRSWHELPAEETLELHFPVQNSVLDMQ